MAIFLSLILISILSTNLVDSIFSICLECSDFNCCHSSPCHHQLFLDYCSSLLIDDTVSTITPSSLLNRADTMIPLKPKSYHSSTQPSEWLSSHMPTSYHAWPLMPYIMGVLPSSQLSPRSLLILFSSLLLLQPHCPPNSHGMFPSQEFCTCYPLGLLFFPKGSLPPCL